MADAKPSDLDRLRREIARLIGLLEAHGIAWRSGVCEKPRISCRDCHHRKLSPLTDAAIYGHLAGEHTLGLYPLLENDTCHLLAVDFDEQDWREDARAFLRSCRELAVPAAAAAGGQKQRAHHRLARSRPPSAATHVGETAAGLSGDGVCADFRSVIQAEQIVAGNHVTPHTQAPTLCCCTGSWTAPCRL